MKAALCSSWQPGISFKGQGMRAGNTASEFKCPILNIGLDPRKYDLTGIGLSVSVQILKYQHAGVPLIMLALQHVSGGTDHDV